jgi:DNA invertase Pin-like site-specific DNA recombinase
MSPANHDLRAAPATDGPRPPEGAAAARLLPLRSAKIQDRHRQGLALVYVRQSTPQQILDHRESRERHYALAGHAVALGWPSDRVLLIDEDQGLSGKGAAGRTGFHRLLAEVTMNHAGIVLGLEMSRLARSNKDWHHLLEVCAVFDTLLGDQDGVYDARDPNDRLLLGLKGTMSELELVTMRNRLERGRQNKAERGELFVGAPTGYVKLPGGGVALDPDEQVRAVVSLAFDKFDELGSSYAVFRYLIRNNIRLGVRARGGPRRGQLEWRRPCWATVLQRLRRPIYAGAYAYGRRPVDQQRPGPAGRPAQRWLPPERWQVLKRDRLPAYISWERYLANLRRLEGNRQGPASVGSARRGAALLAGLVVCGTCGLRLQTAYRRVAQPRYACNGHQARQTARRCYGVKAAVVDDLVAQQVLRALEPAALELSLQAENEIEKGRGRLERHGQQQLERARYEAERARRQYDAVEPENRLVVRALEQRWEEALRPQRQLEEDYDRFARQQPAGLSAAERARVRALAADLPALWQAAGTTAADRKEVVRCLVERVVVEVRRDSEVVGVTIQFKGGCTSRHAVVRPVGRYEQLEGHEPLLGRMVEWRRAGSSAGQIAGRLNEEGQRTPRRRGAFTAGLVRKVLSRGRPKGAKVVAVPLGPHEWRLPDLAEAIAVTADKLGQGVRRGWVKARQVRAQGPWVVWADEQELQRLRRLAALSQRGVSGYSEDLKTPRRPES